MGFFVYDRAYPSKREVDAAVDCLAEELASDSFTLSEIAERMGITFGSVCALLTNLCGLYGEAVRG
jgi:hypothetical protein